MSETLIVAILGSTVLSTIINAVINSFKDKSIVNKSLIALMGIMIRKTCKDAIKENGVSYEELKQLEDMNSLYKQNGGNGYIKVLMDKVEKLPIVEE